MEEARFAVKNPFTPEEVEALGLEGARFGETAEIEGGRSGPSMGYRQPAVAEAISPAQALALAPHELIPQAMAAADTVGLRIGSPHDAPHILVVASADGRPVRVRQAREAAASAEPQDPSRVALDIRAAGAATVTRTDGLGVAIKWQDRSIAVIAFVENFRPVDPVVPPLPDPPVEAWAEAFADAWLRDFVRARVDASPWSRLAVAGVLARLAEPAAGAAVEALLAGKVDERIAAPRRWARSWTAEERAGVAAHARAAIDDLHEDLDAVTAALAPGDEDWRADVLALLQDRDELEGVVLLLREAGAADAVEPMLAALDERGRRFVSATPGWRPLRDEQLRRAALGDPESWWAALATEGAG